MRLIFLNLLRKPLRTFLTVFGVAVALFLFCFLEAVLTAFNVGVNQSDASRLVVQHKESLSFLLPISYPQLVKQVEGVKFVAPAVWFGGLAQEPQPNGEMKEEFFAQLAMDLENYLPMYPEIKIKHDELIELMRDQVGCVIGKNIADRLRLKIGDRVVLRSTVWPRKEGSQPEIWEFTVRAIYTSDNPTFDLTMMFFHLKYFDEARLFGKGKVGILVVGIDDPANYERIAAAIDTRFQNSPFETRTVTEKAFNIQFVSMVGNLKMLLRSIGSAVVLTMLLVSANTMMMSARERTRDMGILKAMGFSDMHIFRLLIGESMLISGMGALSGVGLAALLVNVLGFNPKPDFFPVFYLPREALWSATLIAVATGVISGLVPAIVGMRLKATEALRSI